MIGTLHDVMNAAATMKTPKRQTMIPTTLPPVERHINDREGRARRYEITPLEYDDSLDLGLKLADLIGGPIGDALRSMLMGDDTDLDKQIDAKVVGKALAELTSLPARIMRAGGSTLVAEMLQGVYRIEKDAKGVARRQDLTDPVERTRAFGGGNQIESFQALRAVLEVNYGPFLAVLSETVSPFLSEFVGTVKSFVQGSPEETEETEENETTEDSGKPTSTR